MGEKPLEPVGIGERRDRACPQLRFRGEVHSCARPRFRSPRLRGPGSRASEGSATAASMTYIYCVNCLAITFVPPWMIYKYAL